MHFNLEAANAQIGTITDNVRDEAQRYVSELLAPDIAGFLTKLRPGQAVPFRGSSGAHYRYVVGSEEKSFLATPEQQRALLGEDLAVMRSNLITATAQLSLRARYRISLA